MSICAFPQVRIYEDFDKMSAKEVYFNEAGNKVTVKLLHFPDIPPEEINNIKFDDDESDNNSSVGLNGSSSSEQQQLDVEKLQKNDEPSEADEEDASSVTSDKSPPYQKKAHLRKKSSTNQLYTRKCSLAFAQAHGIKLGTPTAAATATATTTAAAVAGVEAATQTSVAALATTTLSPTITHKMPTIMFTNSKSAVQGVPEPIYIGDCGNISVGGGNLRRQMLGSRRSLSPNGCLSPGYMQYSKSLLEVPMPRDYGYASSDDLSSEWDSDVSTASASNNRVPEKKPSGWRKIRNIVQWTPFFQTYKKQRYPWVQLAGHQGNFKAGPEQGTVLKKLCPKEEDCFQVLMKDVLRPYVPEYKGQVTSEDGESVYLQLQDLLSDFYQPCVMDCKIGVRTYLEEELSKAKEKPKLRKDMYEKMIQIDPDAPNEEEHKAKGVTKPRYMVWRETISSTATLGFRIEGIKKSDGTSSKDFKTTKSREQIKQAFKEFINGSHHALPRYIQRLRAIHATLECSDFFRTHEVIGSSLLFVHDRTHASVWLIDFAKTVTLPADHQIDHNTKWKVGNHEDGYLIGINNLIELFNEIETEGTSTSELTVSTTNSSSTSSSASMSPMRSVSESNIDEATVGAVVEGVGNDGGGDGGGGGGDGIDIETIHKKQIEEEVTMNEDISNKSTSEIAVKEQKTEQCPEKEDLEEMEKTTTKIEAKIG